MAIYVAVAPFQWRWSNTVEGAITKALSTFNAGKFNGTKLPVKLYLLNRKISETMKRWVLSEDATYLGTYRAFSENGSWVWTKYI